MEPVSANEAAPISTRQPRAVGEAPEGQAAPAPPPQGLAAAPGTPAAAPWKRRKRWLRRVLWMLVALALVGFAVYAWLPKPVAVETAAVGDKAMLVTVDEAGRARVRDRYVLSAPLTGKLLRIELRPGDAIAAGATVARMLPLDAPLLDPRSRAEAEARVGMAEAAVLQARAAVQRAELALGQARRDAERLQGLAAAGAVATDDADRAAFEVRIRQEELASTRFAADMAAHEAEMARVALKRLEPRTEAPRPATSGAREREELSVPAPIAGRVLRVLQESADVVGLGTPLVELGDATGLEIVCDVLTPDAVRIHVGTRATVERWGGEPLGAHVSRIEPSAFTRMSALGVEEQRVKVVLDLDDARDKWAALGDGYAVEVRLVVWERPAVLAVPASAVFRHDSGWAVYAVEQGRARLRPIEAGERNALEVEVRDGLAAGAEVILHPSDKVAEGVRVATR
ncbi:MAG: efflux transporter periplasmic adaptor subunit [Myxococcales bacterium]|nr:efflux transporter periplasmic adaptor subunit [Myxococcales bacterium]